MHKTKSFITILLRSFLWLFPALIWLLLSISLFWDFIYPTGNITPEEKRPTEGGYNYLIIAPKSLEESAHKWAEYREEGYQVKVFLIDEEGQQKKETTQEVYVSLEQKIEEVAQEIYKQSGEPYPFFVLLIGSEDPTHLSYLPHHHFPLPEEKAASLPFDNIIGDTGVVRLKTWTELCVQ